MPKAPINLLSDTRVKGLKSKEKDYFINDGGGLYLRVRPHNVKEWIFRYSSPLTKKRRKVTIGNYTDKTLSEARITASEYRILVSKDIDPIIQTETARDQERHAGQADEKRKAKTVARVFEKYKREELQNRKDKGHDAERIFKKDVFPVMGDKPIHEVTRDDCKQVLDRPLKRKANRQANVVLAELKQFFSYAEDEELLAADPTRRIKSDRVGGKQKPRKRVLKDDELALLNKKLPLSNLPKSYMHAMLLYLATGCRRNEIEQSEHKSFSIKNRNFFIPEDKSKNTDEHNIFLSDFALRQYISILDQSTSKTWVLPNLNDDGALTKGTLTKNIKKRQPHITKSGRVIKNNTLELLNGRWILHDLRRTAATIMQHCGTPPHIVKKCLNQRIDDKMVEIYQHAELIDEQKQAFEKLGEYLEVIFTNY